MRNQLFVAAAAAMLMSCPYRAWSSEGPSSITTEICKLESDVNQAVVAHDGGLLTSLFADEYQHTNFFGSVADKKAEVDFFTSTDFAIKSANITDCAVHVYQDVAVATGVNTWTDASYRGRNLSGSYRFTRVYVRRKGHWQIVASHASKITPA
jgi:ketosteroid isomerase-like protein